ncbi:MAG: ABC transporter permease [Vicinamibacteria bacterium]|nr:ABC transporter permease [Vicinamibacteria bacterium]
MPNHVPRRSLLERAHSWLVRLYPSAFREEYERELGAAFEDQLSDAGARRRRVATSALTDVLLTAPGVHLDLLRQDLRYAWRTLTSRAQRSFAVAAILTLALGVGAATAIFSVVHAVMLAPLPFHAADRLVRIYETNQARNIAEFSVSVPNLDSWQRRVTLLSLAAARDAPANLTDGGPPEHVLGLAVSAGFLPTLGLSPVAGRHFHAAEDRPGGARVAMVSEGLWQRRYGGAPGVIGRSIAIDGVSHTVVGIVPQDAGFSTDIDLWVPMAANLAAEDRNDRRLAVVGRLADGATLDQAQAELNTVAAALEREFPPSNGGWRTRLVPALDWIVGDELQQRLKILLVAVGLLLAVACANVANLQMARAASRTGEIGVRLALGASRARLVRQTLTESLLLAGTGGALGLALAWAMMRGSRALLPDSIPRLASLSLNGPVLAAALVATVLVAIVAGLLPALLAGKTDIRDAVQHASRPGASRTPVRNALVALQLALSTCLVVGAALLLQSTWNLQRLPLGFSQPDHLLTANITRPQSTTWDMDRDVAFYDSVLREAAALPGVTAVGLTSGVPLGEGNTAMEVSTTPRPEGQPMKGVQASWRIVSGGYFRVMDVPVARGRVFDPRKDPSRSLVLSEGLAKRLWPGGEGPVGRAVFLGNGQQFTVLGVVGDVRLTSIARDPAPAMYFPTSWYLWPTMTMVMRTDGDPTALTQPLRAAVARVDAAQPIFDIRSMRAIVRTRLAEPWLNATLLAIFAALALALAAVGVAGVMAFAVARRTSELAVRQALGASPRQAMAVVLSGGLKMCVAGIAAGTVSALMLGQVLAGLLFGVTPYDVPTLAATGAAMFAVAALACWLPARRATRISPTLALREQ